MRVNACACVQVCLYGYVGMCVELWAYVSVRGYTRAHSH